MDPFHYFILQLVRVCKGLQRQALAQNAALAAIIGADPEARAGLTGAKVRVLVAAADEAASKAVDNEFSELEEAILLGSNFLPALKRYLDKNP
jgi:hypothetical protein